MPDIHDLLKQFWGFDRFRPMQEDIITSVLDGQHTLALLPTGGGKSLCYQLPALALPGKTLVISPLIALMQDQVESLESRGVAAAAIHSGMDRRQVDVTIDNWVHGPSKLLFVAPERITTPIFWERLKRVALSLVAVDEAHCISQWGYDFRPSYFDIIKIKEIHPQVPFIALTATATKVVIADILLKLGIRNNQYYRKSFYRDNLSITVIETKAKEAELLRVLAKLSGTGIIYQRNRKQTRQIAQLLAAKGYSVTYYHGGLTYRERQQRQEAWMTGKAQIIVCTNAFGMGIDKPDVRFVMHLDIPPSIEEYYQEIGRAGRDGQESFVVSILNDSDFASAIYNLQTQYYPISDIKKIYHSVHSYLSIPVGSGEGETFPFDLSTFIDHYGMPPRMAWSVIRLLEQEGWILLSDGLHTPSKAMILLTGPQVNELLRDQPERLSVVHHMLRRYEGLFVEHSVIDEEEIATMSRLPVAKVRQMLRLLHGEGILVYVPAKEENAITILRERLAKNNFTIDEKTYGQRRERAKQRLDSMLSFFRTETCRQQLILAYFGEEAGPCGRCDVCRGSRHIDYTQADISIVQEHLATQTAPALQLATYLQLWPYNKRRKVKVIIDHLLSAGLVLAEDGHIRLADAE